MARHGTSADFIGNEHETAYEMVLGAIRNGGFGDQGKDLLIPDFGSVQVKASLTGMMSFLKESIRRGRGSFIEVCVGEPGTREEILQSLKCFGAWIGKDIPGRQALLEGIAHVRKQLAP